MSLNLTLNTAISGLSTQQTNLQIVSNNIGNASTEGFSRKQAAASTRVLDGIGAGVELGTIQRTVDQAVSREIRDTTSIVAVDEATAPYFQYLQDLFGEPAGDGTLSANLGDLATSLEAMAVNPGGSTERSEVVNAALKLTRQLNAMSTRIQELRGEVATEIGGSVEEINRQLTVIADLNDKIKDLHIRGESTAQLEDERDLALKNLAGEINIRTFERPSGEVVIYTSEGPPLLDTVPTFVSHAANSLLAADVTYENGGIGGVILKNRDLTTVIEGGRLKGLIEARDSILPGLQAELDQLTSRLRDEINALHNKGTGLPPPQNLIGSRAFADPAADSLTLTGKIRIAVVDESGLLPENLATAEPFEVDFATLPANPTIQDVVDAINAQATASPPQVMQAQLNASGQLEILTLNPDHRLVLDEGDSQVASFTPSGEAAEPVALTNGAAPGFSHFFGLNDFFSAPSFPSGQADTTGISREITLRQALIDDPRLIARAATAFALPLTGGDSLVTSGENGIVQAIATKFDEALDFDAAGHLPANQTSLSGYAAEIVFENSTAALRSETNLSFQRALAEELELRGQSISGVNVDEELANMIIVQQAFSASARMITTVQELFQVIQNMV